MLSKIFNTTQAQVELHTFLIGAVMEILYYDSTVKALSTGEEIRIKKLQGEPNSKTGALTD